MCKSTSEFYKRKISLKNQVKEYFLSYCKTCQNQSNKQWSKANRDKVKKMKRASYERKKAGIPSKGIQSYESIKRKQRAYKRHRWRTCSDYRVMSNIRRRINYALRGNRKIANTEKLLGMSAEECRKYLESLFTEGMNWDNVHIDHIVPCASFTLSDPEQQRKCFHYTNLTPLFAKDNLSKGCKITRMRKWVDNCTGWVDDLHEASVEESTEN